MTYTTQTTILGPSKGDPNAIIAWLKKQGCKRPNEVEKLITTLAEFAPQFGIRFEVPVALCLQECNLNGVPFANSWWVNNLNAGSIGITGDPAQNAASRVFPSGREAALAILVHLYIYAKGATLPASVAKYQGEDWRFQAVKDAGWVGIAPTLKGLSNRWAADPIYDVGITAHLNKLAGLGLLTDASSVPSPDKETPPMSNEHVVDTLKDVITDAIGKGPTGAPSTTYAPVKLLPLLDQKAGKSLFERDALNAYFGVNQDVTALRDTGLLQYAGAGSPKTGDVKKGDKRHAGWGWVDKTGTLYLYDDKGDRLLGTDWQPASGAIVVPDPSPLPPTPKPAPTDPTIITAQNYRQVSDPQRLLPPIVWSGSPNFFPNRNGGNPTAIVYHITDDLVLDNTLSWFQNNTSNASSHFVIDRDGTVYQCVSSLDGAWTNGDAQKWRTDIPWLVKTLQSGANVNNSTISYEFVGKPSVPPTDAQYASAIKLSRYFCHPKVYGINTNRSHQNRHADVNGVTRTYCPGQDFRLDYIIKELGGDPTQIAA